MLTNRTLAEIIAVALAALVGMTVHEFAHCYVADRNGDPTPRSMGRITLNPLVHINWLGWAMWALVGFGILGSAPIEPRNLTRRGYLAAVAAGPISNLLLALVFALPFRFGLIDAMGFYAPRSLLPSIQQLMTAMVTLNIALFLFNLLPIPGLDGWKILLNLVPREVAYQLAPLEQYGMYIFIGLIALSYVGLNIFGFLLGQPSLWLYRFVGLI